MCIGLVRDHSCKFSVYCKPEEIPVFSVMRCWGLSYPQEPQLFFCQGSSWRILRLPSPQEDLRHLIPHLLLTHSTHACQLVSQLFHFLSAPKLCRWLSIYSFPPPLVRDDRNSRIVDSWQQTFQSTLVFLEKEQCFTGGEGFTDGLSRLNLCFMQLYILVWQYSTLGYHKFNVIRWFIQSMRN